MAHTLSDSESESGSGLEFDEEDKIYSNLLILILLLSFMISGVVVKIRQGM